ncbi:hypothetical protein [uncultured Brevundimonas sp.]|uniref:hypothetical protein n=1 Tax=uncultured Brevundimonas sp. TaxID=213418 RepID=UPI0030EEC11C|tara:strand:- start:1037 stop:1348 length:312 start_codon:yes stop_codon:yes gene_type:complete
MWIVIAVVVAVVGWIALTIGKTASLNNDPVQKELCHLILEMMANGATSDAQMIFVVSQARCLMTAFVDPSQHQTRLAHALSMAKPLLNEEGFQLARNIVRGIA